MMNVANARPTFRLTRRKLLLSAAAWGLADGAATAQTGDAAAFAALIKAARQEGKVIIDGPPIDETREAIVNGFQNKYGIEVSYISSGSARSGARVRAERAAGKYLLDVFVSGSDTPLLTFLPSGWLDPIAPALVDPEVTDVKNWSDNRLWYVDPDRKIIRTLRYVTPTLAINAKLVAPGEVKGWKDILDPKWRGKLIAKDPAVTGAGASLISYFYLTFGPEFVKSLYVDQKPTISRDSRQAAQALAVGNAPIWVGPDQTQVQRFQKLGYPIGFVAPNDGPGIISGGWGFVNLVNKAPNPNAAKLLVNWLLGREGQSVFSKSVKSLSLRTDIDQSWSDDFARPKPGEKYIDTYDYKFILEQRDAAFEKAQKLLGL